MKFGLKNIKKAIELRQSADKLILEIDKLIWKTTNKIYEDTGDKWNLSYFLHHEIMKYFSRIIADKFGFKKLNPESINKNLGKKITLSQRYNPIFLNANFSHEYYLISIISKLLSMILNLFFLNKNNFKNLEFFVYGKDKQLKSLEKLFFSISNLISIQTNGKRFIFVDFLNSYNFLKVSEFSKKEIQKFPIFLLVGTKLNFFYRYLVCMCRKRKAFVCSSTHSHGAYFYQEPSIYYAELTGANLQYEYGLPNIVRYEKHSASNEFTNQKTCFRSSRVIKKIKKYSKRSFSFINRNEYIYAPTGLSDDGHFYFPYRQLPDDIYIDHWEYVLESSPNIFILLHPKSYRDGFLNDKYENFKRKWSHRILKESLYYYIYNQNYKIFIVDSLSTTSTELLAARKKLIYIDIKLRIIDKEYLKVFSINNVIINYKDFYENPPILMENINNIKEKISIKKEFLDFQETDQYS